MKITFSKTLFIVFNGHSEKKRRKKNGARFWSMAKHTLSKTSGHIFQLDFKFPYVRENKKSTHRLNEH